MQQSTRHFSLCFNPVQHQLQSELCISNACSCLDPAAVPMIEAFAGVVTFIIELESLQNCTKPMRRKCCRPRVVFYMILCRNAQCQTDSNEVHAQRTVYCMLLTALAFCMTAMHDWHFHGHTMQGCTMAHLDRPCIHWAGSMTTMLAAAMSWDSMSKCYWPDLVVI